VSVGLREATAADSAFVFDVRRQAFRQYVDLEERWNDSSELARHIERFERQRFRVIVAEAVEAGYMATVVYPAATAGRPACLYLHQLMLLPRFHSRGIGSACLRLLAAEARALGLPLRLRVRRVNPRAFAFYIAAGCEIVAESESHYTLELRAGLCGHSREDL
jgi:ribosomal protein S18 acetylase RimI-like enzyme